MRRWLALRDARGLTFAELSQRTGVPRGTLGYWAWKLRQDEMPRCRGARRRGFVELVAAVDGPGTQGDRTAGQIEIVLESGRRVVVSGEVEEAVLERVLEVLSRC